MDVSISQLVAVNCLMNAKEDLEISARAIPAERALWRPGGAAHHAVAIVAHSAIINMFYSSVFTGAPLSNNTQDESNAVITSCIKMDDAIKLLQESVIQVSNAIRSISTIRMEEKMMMPWGERRSMAQALLTPAMHMQYHEGQLNYLQMIFGDDEYH